MHDLRRKEWKHKDIPCWTENQVHGSRFKTSIFEESKKKKIVAGHNGPGRRCTC